MQLVADWKLLVCKPRGRNTMFKGKKRKETKRKVKEDKLKDIISGF